MQIFFADEYEREYSNAWELNRSRCIKKDEFRTRSINWKIQFYANDISPEILNDPASRIANVLDVNMYGIVEFNMSCHGDFTADTIGS